MKRLLLSFLLCALFVAAPASGDERVTVFRDLAWGDPVEVLGDVRVAEDGGRFKEYIRRNEDLALGPVNAIMIHYGFFDNQLFKITVGTRSDEPLDRLVRSRYGTPDLDLSIMTLWTVPEEDTKISYGSQQGFKIMILTGASIDEAYSAWRKEQEALEAQSAW